MQTHKEYMKLYYAKNRKAYQEYYKVNKEQYIERGRRWRTANREKTREIRRRSYWNNKALENQRSKEYVLSIRKRVLMAYGGKKPVCLHCGNSDMRVLEIDHIFNDGKQDRQKIGAAGTGFFLWLIKHNFPNRKKYQLLCKNCNYLKYWNLTLKEKRRLRCALP